MVKTVGQDLEALSGELAKLSRRVLDAEAGTDPAIYTRGDVTRLVEKRLAKEKRTIRELQARLDEAEDQVEALRREIASLS